MTALNAANTFTPAVQKLGKQGYSISISGTFVGTLTVQRSKDGSTWFDIGTYTSPKELDGEFGSAYFLRVGFKTGEFTSGVANVDVY